MGKVVAAVDPMSVRAHTQASLFCVSHPVKATIVWEIRHP